MTAAIETAPIPCEESALDDSVGKLFICGGDIGAMVVDIPPGMEKAKPEEVNVAAGDFIAAAVSRARREQWQFVAEDTKGFSYTDEHCDGLNLPEYVLQVNTLHEPETRLHARAILRMYTLSEYLRTFLKESADIQFDDIGPTGAIPHSVFTKIRRSCPEPRAQIADHHPLQTIAFINGYPAEATELPDTFQTHEFMTMVGQSQVDTLCRRVTFSRVEKTPPPGVVFVPEHTWPDL